MGPAGLVPILAASGALQPSSTTRCVLRILLASEPLQRLVQILELLLLLAFNLTHVHPVTIQLTFRLWLLRPVLGAAQVCVRVPLVLLLCLSEHQGLVCVIS